MTEHATTQTAPAAPPLLLDVRGVAAALSVCDRQVWRLVKLGHLPPPVKIGTSTRWRAADLAAAIAALPTASPVQEGGAA